MTFGADNRTLVYASTKEGSWELYRARIGRSEDPNFPNATNIIEEKLDLGVKGEKMYPSVLSRWQGARLLCWIAPS